MYCQKCGNQIEDNSIFCSKCGNKIVSTNTELNMENVKGLHNKKSMFVALCLNIFSVLIPALLLGFVYLTDSPFSSIVPNFDEDNMIIYLSALFGVIISLLGFLIYFLQNKKVKRLLSYIYLASSIINMALLFVNVIFVVIITCGITGAIFISPILQIVAGSKFVIGSKVYDE